MDRSRSVFSAGPKPIAWALLAVAAGSVVCNIPMSAVASSTGATGVWGGDRTNVLIGSNRTTIEFDCGMVTIDTPLKIGTRGSLSAKGNFEDMAGGPVNPDLPANLRLATLSGRVSGDILNLTIRISGEPEPRRIRLERNRRVKLIRCA